MATNDSPSKQIALLSRARKALAEAKTLEETKSVRDMGEAAIKLAKSRRDIGLESIQDAQEIVRRAERKLGGMLKDTAKRGRPKKDDIASHLSDLGISGKQSSRWQSIAMVPERRFQEWVQETKEAGEELTQAGLLREYTKLRRAARAEENAHLAGSPPPTGLYKTIVIDPPWPMKKIERDCRPNQTATLDYPTMPESELESLVIPADENCHFFCWATNRFLPMAIRLLPKWGFKYICCFVWAKPGGYQPVGLPQYNCEFAIYARRGSPKFVDTKQLPLCFTAPRGQHSEKPAVFYEIIKRVTEGPRLDMFNRRHLDGFDGWGNESPT